MLVAVALLLVALLLVALDFGAALVAAWPAAVFADAFVAGAFLATTLVATTLVAAVVVAVAVDAAAFGAVFVVAALALPLAGVVFVVEDLLAGAFVAADLVAGALVAVDFDAGAFVAPNFVTEALVAVLRAVALAVVEVVEVAGAVALVDLGFALPVATFAAAVDFVGATAGTLADEFLAGPAAAPVVEPTPALTVPALMLFVDVCVGIASFEAFRTISARSAMAFPHMQNGRAAGCRAL